MVACWAGSNPVARWPPKTACATLNTMLTDGVIILRHPTLNDAPAIYEGCQDPDVPMWTNVPSPYTREHALDNIHRTDKERAAGKTQAFLAFLAGSFAASCSLM